MNLETRLQLLQRLREYILSTDENWERVKQQAFDENAWFVPQFINFQINHIGQEYLSASALNAWIGKYNIPPINNAPKNIGIVMAGNIPLAGFHDFLAAFVSGHRQRIKPSSKDFR